MNNSEVLQKLRAYLKCQKRQVKGIYYACNNKKCDDCDLCYMQGTTGEHIEAIEVATQALEKLKDNELGCRCNSSQTNAEKIRSMSDEELAEFLITFKNTFGEEYEGEASCMDWLQSEAE